MSTQKKTKSQKKVKTVGSLIEMLQSYQTVGVIKLEPMKGQPFQNIRQELRTSNNKMVVAKNSLIKIAIKRLQGNGKNIHVLLPFIKGSCALLFTNNDPYKIAQSLENNKLPAFARNGQIALSDVVIPKMDTGVQPGNFINELNSIGLPTKIERGTISIPEPTIVIHAGKVVSKSLANILLKLNITPFEVGLSVLGVVKDKILINKEELLKDYFALISSAHQEAINLGVNISYIIDETIQSLISTANAQSLVLAAVIHETNSSALSPELIELLANSEISEQQSSSTSSDSKEEEQPKEEEEEVDEADMELGSLFG